MRKLSQEEAIQQAKIAHPNNEYDYSKANYQGMTINWIVICKTHGAWPCTPQKSYSSSNWLPRMCW